MEEWDKCVRCKEPVGIVVVNGGLCFSCAWEEERLEAAGYILEDEESEQSKSESK